jgi:hypothetical protein
MPFHSQFSPDGAGILEIGTGLLTGDELIAGTISIGQAGERLSRVRYALVDFSGVVELQATPQDVAKLADEDIAIARRLPNLAIAVVASQPLVFGMSRMWEALAHQTGWHIMVVQTLDEAVNWLRREVPDVVIA